MPLVRLALATYDKGFNKTSVIMEYSDVICWPNLVTNVSGINYLFV